MRTMSPELVSFILAAQGWSETQGKTPEQITIDQRKRALLGEILTLGTVHNQMAMLELRSRYGPDLLNEVFGRITDLVNEARDKIKGALRNDHPQMNEGQLDDEAYGVVTTDGIMDDIRGCLADIAAKNRSSAPPVSLESPTLPSAAKASLIPGEPYHGPESQAPTLYATPVPATLPSGEIPSAPPASQEREKQSSGPWTIHWTIEKYEANKRREQG